MANLQAINKAEFTNKSWKRNTKYFFAASDSVCALCPSEMPRAMMNMPLAFAPTDTDGEYTIVAVQGLQQGVNSFVHADGKWAGNYVPSAYRSYPFVLSTITVKGGDVGLCFDTDSELLVDDDTEEPFLDEEFELSKEVSEIVDLLAAVENDKSAGNLICKSLLGHGLLKPWEIKYGAQVVGGLFCIDEAAFNSLSDDAYTELRWAGAIPVIYCQLLSMQGINDLAKKSGPAFLPLPGELEFDGVSEGGNISFANL